MKQLNGFWIAALFGVLVVGAAQAGVGSWTVAGRPWMTFGVTDISIGYEQNPPLTVVYAADTIPNQSFFYSTDEGSSWLRIFPLPGGSPKATVCNPINPSEVWIGVPSGNPPEGVYWSSDRGEHWEPRNNGLTNKNVQCFATHPSDPAVVYCGTFFTANYPQSIFKTTNSGQLWTDISPNPTNVPFQTQDIAIAPSNPQVLYVGGVSGGPYAVPVYKSTDAGNSWQPAYNGIDYPKIYSVAVDPTNPDIAFAGGPGDFYKTTDGGNSWVDRTFVAAYIWGLVIDPTYPPPNQHIFAAVENPNEYPWQNSGVWFSSDGGNSWIQKNSGLYDRYAISIAYDPPHSGHSLGVLYLGTKACFYRSTDYGDNWVESDVGMEIARLKAVDARLPTLFTKAAGTPKAGIHRSTDAGNTWQMVFGEWLQGGDDVPNDVLINPSSPSVIMVIYSGVNSSGRYCAQIWRSTDNGEYWEMRGGNASQEPGLAGYCLRQDPDNPSIFLAGLSQFWLNGRQGYPIKRSTDGGYDWGLGWGNFDSHENIHVRDIALDPVSPGVMYFADTTDAIRKSGDGGVNWVTKNQGLPPPNFAVQSLSLDPSDHLRLLAGSEQRVWKTTDGAENWVFSGEGIPTNYPYVVSLARDPEEPAIVYASCQASRTATQGYVYASVDHGAMWVDQSQGLPQMTVNQLKANSSAPDTVFAATHDGVYYYSPPYQFKSLTSANSEASDYNSQRKLVRQEGTYTTLHAVYHSGGSAGHNVYYTVSTDGGNSWSPKAFLGEGKHPAIALDVFGNPHVVYLSDDNHIIYHVGNPWGGGWMEPVKIYNPGTNYTLGPPALVTDPGFLTDRGHVIFHQVGPDPDAPHSILYGLFNPFDPGLIQPVTVDGPMAEPCLRPSLGFYNGWVRSLHAVWARGNQVYYSSKVLDSPDPWTPPYQVSDQSTLNHDPNIEVYGDKAHVAWVESGVFPSQVTYRFKDLWEGWFPRERVAYLPSDYATPQMAAGSYCVWGQGDGEVYYSNRNPYEGWGSPANWSNTSQRSASPQVAFAPWMMGTTLFCFWTENTTAPYQEYFATTIGPLGGFFSLDAGQEQASPYTVHRGGYQRYANHPEKTVDTDGSYLSYRFRRLDPKKLYLVRASYYQVTGSSSGLEVKVDGTTFANVAVPNRSVIRCEAWLPSELYADSVVELVIRKKSGTLGTLGYLELCQAEPKGKGGPQSSGLADLSLPRDFSLGAGYPNPMTSEARIDYALPKASGVDLTVYNISGQVVRRLLSEPSKSPGRYSVLWDGRNENGHRVPGGVYFYRLSAGSFVETKKMVVVR